nr:EOG090X0FQ9 [Sida crystallina]
MLLNSGYQFCKLINTGVVYVSVRGKRVWCRKPLGSPVAKSKLFRVPTKPNLPEDEVRELKRLDNVYKAQMKSIRQYFFEQALKQADSGEKAQSKHRLEEEEHLKLMEENRIENEKIAAARELRLKAAAEKTKDHVLHSLVKKEQEEMLMKEQLLAYLQEQEACSKTFITRDNIVNAIETALANPENLNFAINQEGYVFRGKVTNIDEIPVEKRERLTLSV